MKKMIEEYWNDRVFFISCLGSQATEKEIEKFSKMAEEWWDPNGKFKPLHKFNPIRIRYIKDNIINHFNLKDKNKPLNKINILEKHVFQNNTIY